MALVKEIAKNAVLAMPGGRSLWLHRQLRRGYGVEASAASYVRSVYELHARLVSEVRPVSGDVLEIGPGGNIGVTALFVANGCDSGTCLDVIPFAAAHEPLYRELGVADIVGRINYVCPAAIEDAPFPDASFDIVFSHACFEHFADPAAAIREIARLLKPGGVTSHEIDLRDHRSRADRLNFLRYPDWLWNLSASHRPGQTNRWRASDLVGAFGDAGLEIVRHDPREQIVVTNEMRMSFARRFRGKDIDDLGILTMILVAKKPHKMLS